MRIIIIVAAFLFMVGWMQNGSKKERAFIAKEDHCIDEAVNGDDMRECFKLMEENKVKRAQ